MIVNTFKPKYMKNFKCIGSKCTDTCCAGWDVNIDKNTLNKYEKSTGELNNLVKGKYVVAEKNEDFFNAGFMILKSENRCPFLNDNLLCDIHGTIGEENLCITCKNYPRVFNIVDDIYEKSALTSCEEVCKLALLQKEKMEFVEEEEKIDEEIIEIRRIIDTEAFIGTDSLFQYFWDIRVVTINILQNREYSIDERLRILKGIFKEIQRLKESDLFEEIEEIFENINNGFVDYEQYKGETINDNQEFKNLIGNIEIINGIRHEKLKMYAENYRKKVILKNCEESDIKYNKINEEISEYAYIFENYLINQIFKDLIPFNNGGGI